MNLVPDWAPNIHPLLVHFPIALLITGAGLDVVAWVCRRNAPLRHTATLLSVVGTGAAVAAYITGRAASQAIWLPGMAQAVVREHWDWAFRTVWFFSVVTGVRLVLLRPSRRDPSSALIAALALTGLVGIGLLVKTGDRGGRLVYQHGVGTAREQGR
jgi:uncharacterized membrane protein